MISRDDIAAERRRSCQRQRAARGGRRATLLLLRMQHLIRLTSADPALTSMIPAVRA